MELGYIYIIRNHTLKQFYIGATISPVKYRISRHRNSRCKARPLLDHPDHNYEILESFKFSDVYKLRDVESRYIKNYKYKGYKCVNKNIPNRMKKHIYSDSKECAKAYYKLNRDKILKKNKETYIFCQCGSMIRRADKSQHKKSNKHNLFIENQI